MKTKYLIKFLNRLAHYDADLELADILVQAARTGAIAARSGKYIFPFVDPTKHPRLAARKPTDTGRRIAIGHLMNTLYGAFIKDLYEDVGAYAADLLAGAARAGLSPDRLIGEHRMTFDANDLLRCQSWNGVVSMVSKSLFRAMENERSTARLLSALNKKLDLKVPDTSISAALPYFELRHLLVHADGVADEAFCRANPNFGATPGNAVVLTFQLVAGGRKCVVDMVTEFDRCAVLNGIVLREDLHPEAKPASGRGNAPLAAQ